MPLLGPHMALAITSALAAKGFVGPALPSLSSAIGVGTCTAMIGGTFQTLDTGTAGVGTGTGVGLTGIVSGAVKGFILTEALGQGLAPTPKSADVYGAVADAWEQEVLLATLSSTDPACAPGAGIITPGSVTPTQDIGSSIQTVGVGAGLGGAKWPNFANAIGKGIFDGLATASGNLVIVGTPAGGTPPPVTNVPGTGVLA